MRAEAHDRSVSHSLWTLDDRGADVVFSIDTREFTRLADWTLPEAERIRRVGALVASSLAARRGAVPCSVVSAPVEVPAAPGRTVFRWRLDCLAPGAFEIRSRLFDTLVTAHLNVAKVTDPTGALREGLLGAENPTLTIEGRPGFGFASSVAAAFVAGARQAAARGDVLACLLGLMLAASSGAEALRLTLSYSVACSLTLAAATLTSLRFDAASVLALMGLTVAVVAVENLCLRTGTAWARIAAAGDNRSDGAAAISALVLIPLLALAVGSGRVPASVLAGGGLFAACYLTGSEEGDRPGSLRWVAAFVFGLLHGLGLASVLGAERLPAAGISDALLGFHAGIALVLLALLAPAWVLLAVARERLGDRYRLRLVEPASTALLAAGSCWFLLRCWR